MPFSLISIGSVRDFKEMTLRSIRGVHDKA